MNLNSDLYQIRGILELGKVCGRAEVASLLLKISLLMCLWLRCKQMQVRVNPPGGERVTVGAGSLLHKL